MLKVFKLTIKNLFNICQYELASIAVPDSKCPTGTIYNLNLGYGPTSKL